MDPNPNVDPKRHIIGDGEPNLDPNLHSNHIIGDGEPNPNLHSNQDPDPNRHSNQDPDHLHRR